MRKLLLSIVFSGLAIMLPQAVQAHTDEYMAKLDAPHGGQMRMAGPYHLELVAKDGELRLYLTTHMDKKVLTEGSSGKANFYENGKKVASANFQPVFGNMMKATGDFKITPETEITVKVVMIGTVLAEGNPTHVARFKPMAQGAADAGHEHHGDHSQAAGDDNASEDGDDEDSDD